MSETAVLKAVLEALRAHHAVAWAERMNVGGAYLGDPGKGKGQQFVRFGWGGMADITGQLRTGQRLEVEVKASKQQWRREETFQCYFMRPAVLSETQKHLLDQWLFLKLVRDHGGVAFPAWSVQMVYAQLGPPVGVGRQVEVDVAPRRRGKSPHRWQELPAGAQATDQGRKIRE